MGLFMAPGARRQPPVTKVVERRRSARHDLSDGGGDRVDLAQSVDAAQGAFAVIIPDQWRRLLVISQQSGL